MIRAVHPTPVPPAVPALLGFIAGFVDICAFLGLFQIFVAQLTGSFVFAGAWLIIHHGELLMMLGIPAFFLAGCFATALAVHRGSGDRPLVWVLGFECVLLAAMLLVMSVVPLNNADGMGVIAAALLGVAAMGVQSAMVRLFMRGVPSTNVMTTNTTQLAIDVTQLLLSSGRRSSDEAVAKLYREARGRFGHHWPPMAGFVIGTAVGAMAYRLVGTPALCVPLVGACGLLLWCLRGGARPANA